MKIAIFGDIHSNIEALKTASAIISSGLPPYFAEKLREAR